MKKKVHILLLLSGMLVLSVKESVGQVWNFVGKGLNSKPTAYCNVGDALVVAYNHYLNADLSDSIWLRKWNGTNWTRIPGFPINDSSGFTNKGTQKPRVLSMSYFNGSLYVLLRDYNKPFDSAAQPVYRIMRQWNGAWQTIGHIAQLKNDNVQLMVFKDKLYCVGDYAGLEDEDIKYLASWDGAAWQKLVNTDQDITGHVADAAIFQDDLYVSYADAKGTSSLKYWDGKTFYNMPVPSSLDIKAIVAADQFYLFGYDNVDGRNTMLMREDGGWVNIVPKNFHHFYVSGTGSRGFCAFNKGIIAVGDFLNATGYGNNAEWDGKTWSVKNRGNFNADSIYCIDRVLYGFSAFSEQYNHIAYMSLNFGIVRGHVYKDINKNCFQDSAEQRVSNVIVEFNPGPYHTNTDSTGYFEMQLPNNDYGVNFRFPDYYQAGACVKAGASLHVITNVDTTLNLPISATASVKDLHVSISGVTSGMKAGQGFTETYDIACSNIGTSASGPVTVYLTYPSSLKYISAQPNVASMSPGGLSWTFNNYDPDEVKHMRISLTVPLSVPLGSHLVFRTHTSCKGDVNDENNEDSLVQEVRAAIDPNGKDCNPSGYIKKDGVDRIQYVIHFQNTGNAMARSVKITDTLDNNLPLLGFAIENYSHPNTVSTRLSNSVLTIYYKDIMLPDSTSDEPNSHGFFQFSALMRKDLPIGTVIKNRAYIVFDYQDPIKTNMVVDTIVENDYVSIQPEVVDVTNRAFVLFPNPAQDRVEVYLGTKHTQKSLYITDITGRTLMTVSTPSHRESMTMDVSNLKDGIYFVRTADGSYIEKLVLKR